MEENKINMPVGGMNLDSFDTEVDEREVSYAMNSIMEDHRGSTGNHSNEPGNEILYSVPSGYTFCGHVNLQRDEVLVCSTNDTKSEIGIYDGDYNTIINSSDLGFDPGNPVKGTFRIIKGCERVVYLTDFLNPDRRINLDNLLQYTDEVSTDLANQNDTWNVEEFRLQASVQNPEVTNLEVRNSGGLLYLGVYSFAVEILDQSLNVVSRSRISNPVSVFDESIGAAYNTIDGGYNVDIFQEADGGVPKTNKSIVVSISDLPLEYPYFRVYVIRKTSGDGITKEVFKKATPIEITGTTLDYIFTGVTDQDTLEDYDALVLDNPLYETSREIEIVDRRLVRANLKSNTRDYSSYQRVVNDVTVSWALNTIPVKDQNQPGSPKNPESYFNNRSLMGDEVYMLGVSFIHDDYTESPVFPLIGREKNADDQIIISYSSTDPDLKHLPVKTEYEKWEVYNTALSDGTLAYFESTGTYPSTVDCDGEFIFGDLAGTPIRLFKMPCRKDVAIYFETADITYINLIGLLFDNLVYPDTSIVGHRWHIVPRTEDTKTVLDTGLIHKTSPNPNDDLIFFTYYPVDVNTSVVGFLSPKTLLKRQQNGDHFKVLAKAGGIPSGQSEVATYQVSGSSAEINLDIYPENDTLNNFGLWQSVTPTYRSYTTQVNIGPRSLQSATGDFTDNIVNAGFSNNIAVFNSVDPFPDINGFYMVANKIYRQDIYSNITSLRYKPFSERIYTLSDSQLVYGGDVFISELKLVNILDSDFDGGGLLFNDITEVSAEFIYGSFVESEINYDLIHGGTDCNTRYKDTQSRANYIINKVAILADDGEWLFRPTICSEYYGYNDDYTWESLDRFYFGIPLTFNYCSECLNKYPNRIIWSPASFPEEDQDTFRVYLNEDYTTVGENTGQITGLHYDKNRLLVRTMQSRFQLAPNPQAIATDIDTAYVATGDFLSIPPNEFLRTNFGYAGGQGRFDEVGTDRGLFSIDQKIGQVFLIGGQLEELSSKKYKCHHFLRENLPQFFPISNWPSVPHEQGIGIITVYDPKFDRVIIHKRDYEILNWSGIVEDFTGKIQDGRVYYNSTTEQFFTSNNGNIKIILFGTPQYFRNRSFTMSFSLDYMSWTSFHSYHPDWWYNDSKTFYSTKGDNRAFEHVDRNFSTYYLSKEDYIIEYVIKNLVTFDLDVIEYYAQTYKEEKGDWVDVDQPTFDRIWIYTRQQSTGLQEVNYLDKHLKPYGSFWSNTKVDVVHAEQNYRINQVRDLATNTPVSSSDWEEIQDQYPIDKTPINVDYNRIQHHLILIKDKYIKVRLFFKPEGDYKMTLDIVNSKTKLSEL